MLRRDRRKPKEKAKRTGNVERRQVTAMPAEWAAIDALAARLAEPWGYCPNASRTLRDCARAVLNAEAAGLVTIENGRIYWERRRSSDVN